MKCCCVLVVLLTHFRMFIRCAILIEGTLTLLWVVGRVFKFQVYVSNADQNDILSSFFCLFFFFSGSRVALDLIFYLTFTHT